MSLTKRSRLKRIYWRRWSGKGQPSLSLVALHGGHVSRISEWYNKKYVKDWVNWEESLPAIADWVAEVDPDLAKEIKMASKNFKDEDFTLFDRAMKALYAEFTFERAAEEAQVPIERIKEAAQYVADAGERLATHNWRSASIGNLGGWQIVRALFFLNVLTGSVGTPGGTSGNSWNKFVPKPFNQPPAFNAWNELHIPHEWPLAHYEMSFLLPHFLDEGRGEVDVYISRVYNPMWINPDGFMWLKALQDEEKMKRLTPASLASAAMRTDAR